MSKVHMFLYFSKSSFFNCSCFLSVSSFWSCSSLLCSTPGSLRIWIENLFSYFKHHTNSLVFGNMYKKMGEKPAHQYSITCINKFCKCDDDRHHHTRHGQHLKWQGEQFKNTVTTKVINNEDKINVGPTELYCIVMTCNSTDILCLYLLWLSLHPWDEFPVNGYMEVNIHVCMYVCMYVCMHYKVQGKKHN